MKFPFVLVPRAIYDEQRAEGAQLRRINGRLTRTIVRMKLNGAIVPRALSHAGAIALPPKPEDRIQKAIDRSKYANRAAVKAALRDFADTELAKHDVVTDDVIDGIVERIDTWWKVDAATERDDDTIPLVVDHDETDEMAVID